MRKKLIPAVSSGVFCFQLLAAKQKFIHLFFVDVQIKLLRIPGSINGHTYCGSDHKLMFMLNVFATECFCEVA